MGRKAPAGSAGYTGGLLAAYHLMVGDQPEFDSCRTAGEITSLWLGMSFRLSISFRCPGVQLPTNLIDICYYVMPTADV